MSGLAAFTLFHTALSLVQLVSGIIVVIALMGSRNGGPWLWVYLVSAIATSVIPHASATRTARVSTSRPATSCIGSG